MTVKIIVHPQYWHDTSAAFRDAANIIARQDDSFAIVDPRYPHYILNPHTPLEESVTGSLRAEPAEIAARDGDVLITGGLHGNAPYETLNSILMTFVLQESEKELKRMRVRFPMEATYCKVDKVLDVVDIYIGKVSEDLQGQWSLHIAAEPGQRGRIRTNESNISQSVVLPQEKNYLDAGTHLLGDVLLGLEIPLEEVFKAYVNLTKLWAERQTTSTLRRIDPQREIGHVELLYNFGFDQEMNAFVIDLMRKITPPSKINKIIPNTRSAQS